ncbi:hypothetical protein LDENG_00153380 [Lucifuga dentata]|nr:hypothetical protein LDENG_00153380 [Lucifuga dentata]
MVDDLLSSEELNGGGGGGRRLFLAKDLPPLIESAPPPFMPWVCSTRYKTELCTSYATTGFCKYAERCQFAHGLHELHVPFRHPNPMEQRPALRRRKNVPCRTFRSFGVCPFGTRCNFLHVEGQSVCSDVEAADDGEQKTASIQSPQPNPQVKEWKPQGALCCTFSSFGYCLYGTRCRFQHGLPNKVKSRDASLGSFLFPLLYPGSSATPSSSSPFSSTSTNSLSSSTPPSNTASPLTTPPAEAMAHDAFSFSSQHLSELLLPLALHLQHLESSAAMTASAQHIWNNRAL